MGIWEISELEFSASIHNLQLNTEFTHDYHHFFSWQYQKMSSQSFIILEEQVISTTAKTPETKSSTSGSLELETELVYRQWQYSKLENTYSCLSRGIEFSRIIMHMHNGHETGKRVTVICFSTQQMCTLRGLHATVCSNSLWWIKAIWIKKRSMLWPTVSILYIHH